MSNRFRPTVGIKLVMIARAKMANAFERNAGRQPPSVESRIGPTWTAITKMKKSEAPLCSRHFPFLPFTPLFTLHGTRSSLSDSPTVRYCWGCSSYKSRKGSSSPDRSIALLAGSTPVASNGKGAATTVKTKLKEIKHDHPWHSTRTVRILPFRTVLLAFFVHLLYSSICFVLLLPLVIVEELLDGSSAR